MEVCMDSANWLQGVISHESGGMDSAISSPSGDNMLTCAASRPLMERRLRPQQDQALKCPRCDSTHTKFCYYNNYSLSQPRYFCKTCRRYWTKGGTLRNIPVGGGCRKNKKVAAKKPTSNNNDHSMMNQHNNLVTGASSSSPIHGSTDLHLSFPEVQLSHLYGTLGTVPPGSYLDSKYPRPIDFMESKFDQTVVDGSRSSIQNFMGNNIGLGDMSGTFQPGNFNGLMMGPSSFGISSSPPPPIDGNMDTCQRLMLPYDYHAYEEDHHHHHDDNDGSAIDVKPINTKLVPFDWQDHHHQQQQQHHHNQNQSCLNGVGPWSGLMHPYGPSTTNPLV